MPDETEVLLDEISGCTHCKAHLPAGPRPVVQLGSNASILIIGQAPGSKVHESGIPWDDPSGERLRDWTGISPDDFYNPHKVALMPMGFCYPGKGNSGDLPPRQECAPLWHEKILSLLPSKRLTLLVGSYAQAYYLPHRKRQPMTDRVRNLYADGDDIISLPHPSWRVTGWIKRNPWFEAEILPALKEAVRERS